MQYSTDWGFQAYAQRGWLVRIEVGGASAVLLYYRPSTVMLNYLVAYGVKTGAGTKLMHVITELADMFCVRIEGQSSVSNLHALDPRVKRRRDMEQQKLDDFYRKFGFKFSTSDLIMPKWMTRKPNC